MNLFKGSRLFGATILPFALTVLPVGSFASSVQEIRGVPWTGRPGVTETVNQIMGRELLHPTNDHKPGNAFQELHPRFYPKRPLQNNPDAPFLSHWPAGANSAGSTEPGTPLIP